jgi:hypothetical protein
MLVDNYRANRRRSLDRIGAALVHLKGYFGVTRACDLTANRITACVAARLAAKASTLARR